MKKKCRGTDDFLRMSKEDAEEMYAGATGEAIAETHAAGLPTCHGSDIEEYRMYFLFPDGHREYFDTWKRETRSWESTVSSRGLFDGGQGNGQLTEGKTFSGRQEPERHA